MIFGSSGRSIECSSLAHVLLTAVDYCLPVADPRLHGEGWCLPLLPSLSPFPSLLPSPLLSPLTNFYFPLLPFSVLPSPSRSLTLPSLSPLPTPSFLFYPFPYSSFLFPSPEVQLGIWRSSASAPPVGSANAFLRYFEAINAIDDINFGLFSSTKEVKLD